MTTTYDFAAMHNPNTYLTSYALNNAIPIYPTPQSSHHATPANFSPASPQRTTTGITTSPPGNPASTLQTRQLRPFKAPLYVPAVLRPTERPTKPAHSRGGSTATPTRNIVQTRKNDPITPPDSAGSSFDDGLRAMAGEHLDSPDVQRRILGDTVPGITRIVTDEWNDEALEDVTGAPTRDHWKPDASSPSCDALDCRTTFNLLTRRHHCRRCGNIFCSGHSHYAVPLDQHARFHPQGIRGRACESCWHDFKAWEKIRRHKLGIRQTSELSEDVESDDTGNSTPTAMNIHGISVDEASTQRHGTGSGSGSGSGSSSANNSGRNSRHGSTRGKPAKKEPAVVVGSVPRDWSWSTF